MKDFKIKIILEAFTSDFLNKRQRERMKNLNGGERERWDLIFRVWRNNI